MLHSTIDCINLRATIDGATDDPAIYVRKSPFSSPFRFLGFYKPYK